MYIKILVSRGISPHPVIDPRKCGDATVVIYARPQQYEVTPVPEAYRQQSARMAFKIMSGEATKGMTEGAGKAVQPLQGSRLFEGCGVPPTEDEIALATTTPPWDDLADDTDWDALYGDGE